MAHAASSLSAVLSAAETGRRPDAHEAFAWLVEAPATELLPVAEALTLAGFGETVTYSRKVFIPLTQLCRDVCHYCTFAKAPRRLRSAYLTAEEVLAIARAGKSADCKEALFTLGDKPEARYAVARDALDAAGAASTLDYLERMAKLVLEETGLLPHLNPGLMDAVDLGRLRPVSASMGLMLESASNRLCERGGPHFGSPDKLPARRLETLRAAGELGIPMTTGLLIGIGETRRERIESLLALRAIHETHGHLQELIIQNFKAKSGTKMAGAPEPELEEQLWTIAVARVLFGSGMSIQAPPNLRPVALDTLVRAGVNDWGGVSPVTPDHVNPEAPWPHLPDLARDTNACGRDLVERLALVPAYAREPARWTDPAITPLVRRMSDSRGFARPDRWYAGSGCDLPPIAARWSSLARDHLTDGPRAAARAAASRPRGNCAKGTMAITKAALAGHELTESDIVRLFNVEGRDLDEVIAAANQLRHEAVGETVTYVINRNINYTNICLYHCGFCAFSKGRGAVSLRGPAYNLELGEVARRAVEAQAAGATEVCLQGGIHPHFTGETYLNIVRAVKEAVPSMHVHAFSPLEVQHGAHTLALPLATFLEQLREAGLSTLPGTAAEILDDEIRAIICPDKLRTDEWLNVIGTAHEVGLRTTATIMFGHVEQPVHWARHLRRLLVLQERTGGITEFVPLSYVHMEAPLWRKGRTRSGPSFREAVLMHAVPRLVLHPLIKNIQTSWVKMGAEGAARCLEAGANDLGGTLMNESITRAAGGVHGQLLDAAQLQAIAHRIGRPARQRTTLYGVPGAAAAALGPFALASAH
ncbi:MAG TPA: bifunctional FO biosynthesis protein CofGH [Steroidobacteraceae bacterium]|jgi:FO synthase|nr:bifunctional FO biosynthesis protein CofGH [Steroidobacteraceae bacterium]